MKQINLSLQEIADYLSTKKMSAKIEGENITITGINSAELAEAGDLTFASSDEFLTTAMNGAASAIITSTKAKESKKAPTVTKPHIIADNVSLAHALIKQQYADWNFQDTGEWGQIHPSAVVHPEAKVSASAVVGPNTVIGKGAILHDGSVVMAGSVVEAFAEIGKNSVIHANVTIGRQCKIGNDCKIRSGTVIGSEGFGFAQDENRKHHRIPQTGIVVIEDRCVIGSNNCIDRAAYGETRIRSGIITDNFCHVAHGCDIGEDVILVAMTGIAGSTKLGKRVICSGQTGILDHLNIPDETVLLARAAVLNSIDKAGVYAGGQPLLPVQTFLQNNVILKKLPQFIKDLKALQKEVTGLKKERDKS